MAPSMPTMSKPWWATNRNAATPLRPAAPLMVAVLTVVQSSRDPLRASCEVDRMLAGRQRWRQDTDAFTAGLRALQRL